LVFWFCCTCRADYLSCYGYPEESTPNIDAIAREGVLFKKVVAPVPLTFPSHCSMLTGTIPPFHQVHDNADSELRPASVTIAEIMQRNGYKTGAVVSTFILDSTLGMNQGFGYYNDDYERGKKDDIDNGRRAEETSRLACEWLEKAAGEKFFLFLHYFDPHTPYDPPEPFATRFADNSYAGEIAYTDHCIGQVIKKLKDLRLYDSSLIIITSDHGEMLGEHGEVEHGYFIYESAIKVPLIIKAPGGPQGKSIDDNVVGLIDIVPTICSFAGVSIPSPADVQGEDLSCFFTTSNLDKRRYIYCESLYPQRYGGNSLLGVVTNQWKYIQTTRPELYDLDKDSDETKNLVYLQPKQARLLQEHLRLILDEQYQKGQKDNNSTFDPERRKRLESLGYVVSGTIQKDFRFDQSKTNPKNLIYLHEQNKRLNILLTRKQYKQAKALCTKLLAERPKEVYIHYKLGEIAYGLGDMEGAITHLTKALEIKALRADTYNNLGIALRGAGKLDEAIVSFKKALAIKPDHNKAHDNLGVALASTGKMDEAIKHFRQALQIDANNADTHYNLAITFERLGRLDEAIAHYRQALQLNPNHRRAGKRLRKALRTKPTQ
jgi:arylsulfatase A-like enzyme/Flp pilus assembly protein TadD